MHWAAGCGRLDFVSHLIERCNCCPDRGQQGKRSFLGRTPLHWASRNGHLNVVKYLTSSCTVNIDAKTSDGTTAFCWASWQGHLKIMQYLRQRGCDIHMANSFGCNAVLWSAQGVGNTCETMAWLLESGSVFNLVNSNGHSALHKAAQRGSLRTVTWLVNTLLFDKDIEWALLIGPDMEGNCPSDLCGMEGHESLALWVSKCECDCITRSIQCVDDSSCIPSWLQRDFPETKSCTITDINNIRTQWGNGGGIRRMALGLIRCSAESSASKKEETDAKIDFHGID